MLKLTATATIAALLLSACSSLNVFSDDAPQSASRAKQIADVFGYENIEDQARPDNMVSANGLVPDANGSMPANQEHKESFDTKGLSLWGFHVNWPNVSQFFSGNGPESIDAIFGFVDAQKLPGANEAAQQFVSEMTLAAAKSAQDLFPTYRQRVTKPFFFSQDGGYYQQVLYLINPNVGCYSANVQPQPADQCRIIIRAAIPQKTTALSTDWLIDAKTLFAQGKPSIELAIGDNAKVENADKHLLYQAMSHYLPVNHFIFVAAYEDAEHRIIPAHIYETDRVNFFLTPENH